MRPTTLRLAYALEFFVAIIAIYAAWSEVGGQAALDLMYWAWKLGLGLALAGAIVTFTAAICAQDTVWTLRSTRWLVAIVLIVAAMCVVTYYYMLQEDTGDSDENGTVSLWLPPAPILSRA